MGRDRPKSMRIRFDEGNEHRLDAVQEAAERYDRNRSDVVALACDDIARLAGVWMSSSVSTISPVATA